jgi:hypothetical protein
MTRIAKGVDGVAVKVGVGIGVSVGIEVGVASGALCPQATRMTIKIKLRKDKERVLCTGSSKSNMADYTLHSHKFRLFADKRAQFATGH